MCKKSILFAMLLPLVLFAEEVKPLAEPFTGQVKGTKVRMRIGPDVDSQIVRELNRGELLLVSGEANDYFAVTPPEGTKLYVYRTLVLDNVVEGNHVNVRLSPELDAPVVGQLNAGTRIAGTPCPDKSKWLAIDPPVGFQFFVAKELVNNIGSPELVAQREKREEEVGHLLHSAYLTSQAELRKPYSEIDIERVRKGFERVVAEYPDLPDHVERAKAILATVDEVYAEKASGKLKEVQFAADRRLEQFSQAIEETVSPSHVESVVRYHVDKTDKMRLWEPIEESLYHLWAMERDASGMDAFYEEQALEAELLTGIIEPYARPVQNRPGDFVLRVDQRPVAYLYSTKINLENCVGQKVTLQCLSRPNNHFAFPAYFVLAVE